MFTYLAENDGPSWFPAIMRSNIQPNLQMKLPLYVCQFLMNQIDIKVYNTHSQTLWLLHTMLRSELEFSDDKSPLQLSHADDQVEEVAAGVEDNYHYDYEDEEVVDDGYRTPTSPSRRIPPVKNCPLAPRKAEMKRRKCPKKQNNAAGQLKFFWRIGGLDGNHVDLFVCLEKTINRSTCRNELRR